MTSLGMVFEQYPDEVIIYVSNPKTGIQRKKTFPPAIAEIVDACDKRLSDLRYHDRLRNWGKRNEETALIEPPKSERSTYAELKAKYGDNWGISDIDPVKALPPHPKSYKAMTLEQVIEHYKTHDLAFKPKQRQEY